jgi:light-regulated signal transduction histidine kinase (bacteriophytochrome)
MEAATRDTLAVQATAQAQGDAAADASAAPTLPSQTTGSASHGEGVGLSIVKRLCELLDASVELSTAPGKGTTFRVTFPTRYPKG